MPSPRDIVLRTVADELVDLVIKSKKISVEEAAKKLSTPTEAIQALVDFLVEERVFGIEYKFTTPYIYPYKEDVKSAKVKDKSVTEDLITKEQFYKKAKERNVPYEHIEVLWRKYLQQNLANLKAEFLKRSKEKKISKEKTEELWKKYLLYL
mgnify:FL=1